MGFSEECFSYCGAPEEERIADLHKLAAWPGRFQAPSDELAHYTVALLPQQLSQLSDSLDQTGMEAFLRIHSFLKSLADISQIYLERFRCLQRAKLIDRAEKSKMGKAECLNAKIEGGRISALLDCMGIPSLGKFLFRSHRSRARAYGGSSSGNNRELFEKECGYLLLCGLLRRYDSNITLFILT